MLKSVILPPERVVATSLVVVLSAATDKRASKINTARTHKAPGTRPCAWPGIGIAALLHTLANKRSVELLLMS